MKAKSHLSPEYIASILHYDPDTGIFTWKVRRGNKLAGSRAGSLDKEYCRIRIKRKHYRASRLAVVIMTGKWPERLMDHKDRHRGNDKWTNLRQATSSQNALNRGPQLSLFPHLGI